MIHLHFSHEAHMFFLNQGHSPLSQYSFSKMNTRLVLALTDRTRGPFADVNENEVCESTSEGGRALEDPSFISEH